ncbi:MAG: hypothetical protein A3B81_01150 [Candidatus Muproteobacteria bacterium RIFCSPHIGHO2_02_FULL_65_16]|uniref:Uncharacterized protein n=1 Tax=Candidatus Muproteobacteria bacterium RIFCSPHIGHO2_02_FULL_65_16 TaxID=1817766 RepID=A0A1F6U6U0_9PROT|nr:MAG: hypothetical protein A3B81_01150 [Candidatus Muproteobacteria bacterium RIFCSPHIGHO2_02_FULL_65_16]
MIASTKKVIDTQQKEALISLTALFFIEEHALLAKEQLDDAKKSLQALFLRTSGEEGMLRKLIDILKTTKNIQQSFANIANIITGIHRSIQTAETKITGLRELVDNLQVSAEENADFVGPFLSFSQEFMQKIGTFYRCVHEFLELKETEARHASIYRIARDARERLRQRLSGNLGAEAQGEEESRIKQEVISSFDYTDAENNYRYAKRDSQNKEKELRTLLREIKAMCQMAMNPKMREKADESEEKPLPKFDDVFARFSDALRKHPRLLQMKEPVLDLFKLYQHSFGIFSMDYSNLNKAIGTMMDNTDAYFVAKDEDKDIQAKRDKLSKIEGLIPFLERTAEALHEEDVETYPKFSKRISEIIAEKKSQWAHINEELLRSKVEADAELSTQM